MDNKLIAAEAEQKAREDRRSILTNVVLLKGRNRPEARELEQMHEVDDLLAGLTQRGRFAALRERAARRGLGVAVIDLQPVPGKPPLLNLVTRSFGSLDSLEKWLDLVEGRAP